MSGFDLGDYVPVAERIVTFYELHPTGRIVCTTPEAVVVNNAWFITSSCSVWRDGSEPNTPPDATAAAWEPFPGKTPYTRDSEAMNAETSAIGRALGAAGIAVKRSLATSDEVQLRQGAPAGVPRSDAKSRLLDAVDGDRDAAVAAWAAAFPDNPESVDPSALDAVCRMVSQASAPSAGGGNPEPEAPGDTGREMEGDLQANRASVDEGTPNPSEGSGTPSPSKAAREALARKAKQ